MPNTQAGMTTVFGLDAGGLGATAYGDAVATYLSFSINRCADFNNSLVGWNPSNEKLMHLFNRQAIPMVWDFGESNIIEDVVGGFEQIIKFQSKCIDKLTPITEGFVTQW